MIFKWGGYGMGGYYGEQGNSVENPAGCRVLAFPAGTGGYFPSGHWIDRRVIEAKKADSLGNFHPYRLMAG